MGLLPSLMEVMGKKEEASGIATVACDRSNNGGTERNRMKKRRLAVSNKQQRWQLKLAMAEFFKLSLTEFILFSLRASNFFLSSSKIDVVLIQMCD